VHIISRKKLREAAAKYSGIEPSLDTCFRLSNKAHWRSLDDIRKTYPSADGVKVRDKIYTVFNIGGNDFRLITKIEYDYQKIFVKHLLTQAEYNKEDWKK
jgi:mRNA interferase HigB